MRRARVVLVVLAVLAGCPGNNPDDAAPVPGGGGALTLSGLGSTEVTVSWQAAADDTTTAEALEYLLVRSTTDDIRTVDEALAAAAVVLDWSTDTHTATATDLAAETEYWFNALVRDEAGNIAAYTCVSATTPAQLPDAVEGLTASPLSVSAIRLSWDAIEGASGYVLQRKTGILGTWGQIATPGAGATEYDDTELDTATQYFYRIKAQLDGAETAYTAAASGITDSVILANVYPGSELQPVLSNPAPGHNYEIAATVDSGGSPGRWTHGAGYYAHIDGSGGQGTVGSDMLAGFAYGQFVVQVNGAWTAFSYQDASSDTWTFQAADVSPWYGVQADDGAWTDNDGTCTCRLVDVTETEVPTFCDASADFSSAANPTGRWSYGWAPDLSPGYVFRLYRQVQTTSVTSWTPHGASYPHLVENATGSVVEGEGNTWSPGEMTLHPGAAAEKSVLRFVALVAGTHGITASFALNDTSGVATDVHVMVNGAEVYGASATGFGVPYTYTGSHALEPGDTVDFVVGEGGDGYVYDHTTVIATVSR